MWPFPIAALGYTFHVWPEQSLSGCQHAALSSDVLLMMTWLWEFTCLTSDAALGTLLALVFRQSLRNHLASCLAKGLSDTRLYSFSGYGLVFFLSWCQMGAPGTTDTVLPKNLAILAHCIAKLPTREHRDVWNWQHTCLRASTYRIVFFKAFLVNRCFLFELVDAPGCGSPIMTPQCEMFFSVQVFPCSVADSHQRRKRSISGFRVFCSFLLKLGCSVRSKPSAGPWMPLCLSPFHVLL